MAERTNLTGRLLVADLDLVDPSFHRSVVLVLDHNDQGAFGLVINRPLGLTAAQIVPDPGVEVLHPERRSAIPLYGGGPVETQAAFVLHSGLPPELTSESARRLGPGLVFEPSFPAVRPWITGVAPDLPPDDQPSVRLYLGYAGWSAGQLEDEVAEGAWQVIDVRPDLVFAPTPGEVWRRAMEIRGGFWKITAQTGFKPSLN